MLIERPIFIAGGAILFAIGLPLVEGTTELLHRNNLKGWFLVLVGWLIVLGGALLAGLPFIWSLRDARERRAYELKKAKQAKADESVEG